MKMKDSIIVRRINRRTEGVEETTISGVLCTRSDIVSLDGSGFSKSGQLVVRIPTKETFSVFCGDEISPDGGEHWFTITEVRDNRREDSNLSHWKVIGRR